MDNLWGQFREKEEVEYLSLEAIIRAPGKTLQNEI
jgi:hypothetical protein